jgi:large subunit ribosomal protein L22
MGKVKVERRLADNEAQAHARFVRTSPQKLNLLAQQIRGLTADAALAALSFSKRRAANDVKKLLQSAVANAENNHQLDVDRLFIKEATVGKTLVLKRFRARARGRVGRIRKPVSNLTIIVQEREETE